MPAPVFTPQQYAPLYLAINGTVQTEIDSIDLDFKSGAQDVVTQPRGWAGVKAGAPQTDFSIKFKLPYKPTDQSGVGFAAAGVTAGGTQLDQTMITPFNTLSGLPVQFVVGIGGVGGSGGATAQQNMFSGYIKDYKVSDSIGKACEVTINGSAKFVPWQ